MSYIRISWQKDNLNVPLKLYKAVNSSLNLADLNNPIIIDPRALSYEDYDISVENTYEYVLTVILKNKTHYSDVIFLKNFDSKNTSLKFKDNLLTKYGINIELMFGE